MSRGLVGLFRSRFGKPEKSERKKDRKKLQPVEGAGIANLYQRLKNTGRRQICFRWCQNSHESDKDTYNV